MPNAVMAYVVMAYIVMVPGYTHVCDAERIYPWERIYLQERCDGLAGGTDTSRCCSSFRRDGSNEKRSFFLFKKTCGTKEARSRSNAA